MKNTNKFIKILGVVFAFIVASVILVPLIFYGVYKASSIKPDSKTQNLFTESVVRYPNTTKWEVKSYSGNKMTFDSGYSNPGDYVNFDSPDSTETIVSYYNTKLLGLGWAESTYTSSPYQPSDYQKIVSGKHQKGESLSIQYKKGTCIIYFFNSYTRIKNYTASDYTYDQGQYAFDYSCKQ